MAKRIHLQINGCIQGVGFRPYVFKVAKQLALSGWIKNYAQGVIIEIQGHHADQFVQELTADLPSLVKIKSIQQTQLQPLAEENEFVILESETGILDTLAPPDMVTCQLCLHDLFDTGSRFHHYPFLNCTTCGPRMTILRRLPYDRHQTSMDSFPLCPACEQDYKNPDNRRHHAQGIACADCGPSLSNPIQQIIDDIRRGNIIALKGLGGYQLICDALNSSAVADLRQRKKRLYKPFAIMAANINAVHRIAEINLNEEKLLTSSAGPIVLLRKKFNCLAENIAPNLSTIGVMLPTTPLHHLIFSLGPPFLVVTSGNIQNSPLLADDAVAAQRFQEITDRIVSYNREIVLKMDDSVVQIIDQAPVFIRRARGYVPIPIELAEDIPPTLALGGYLKNTFCITRKNEAFLSQHIGDLNNGAVIKHFHESLEYWLKFLNVKPERIAYDLHPDFYTTHLATDYQLPSVGIQHHHAHLAAVAAEYQINYPCLGLALDGHGYGIDGQSWGGELLWLNHTEFQRLAHLHPLPMPGGNKAAREPWRMAAGILFILNKTAEISKRFSNQTESRLIEQILSTKINCPSTSSCGRLFDAAAALLGIQTHNHYQSQAAMELESLVTLPVTLNNGWSIQENTLNLLPLLSQLLEMDPVSGANLFHGTLISALTDWICFWAQAKQINTILLSGGCFSNKILSEGLLNSLQKKGLIPLTPLLAPPNDGGLSLGQAWIGARIPRISSCV